jgi:hypothetical protein
MTLTLLALGHGYRHGGGHSGMFSDLFRTMAHAAIWSVIGRIIWHAPVWLVVVAFGAAALYLVRSARSRRAP